MKDPAILWYFGDWDGGTCTFSRHLKGCYMDLLKAQFNSGPLSLEEIKTVLGNDFAVWGALSKKFKQTPEGLFFNERLEIEKAKRKAYCESRCKNRKGKNKDMYDHMNKHMSEHMENENENRNEIEKGVQGGKPKKPKKSKTEIEIIYPFTSDEFMNAWNIWKQYKSEQHKFTFKSNISEQAALKDLSEMSEGDEIIAIKLINHAISKGWKGIFEVKFNDNGSKQRKNNVGASDFELASVVAKHFASDRQ